MLLSGSNAEIRVKINIFLSNCNKNILTYWENGDIMLSIEYKIGGKNMQEESNKVPNNKKHSIALIVLNLLLFSLIVMVIVAAFSDRVLFPILILFLGIFVIFPFVLTAIQLFLLFYKKADKRLRCKGHICDIITIVLGVLYSYLYLTLIHVDFKSNWEVVLANKAQHTPIYTEASLTVIVIALVGVIGYLCLHLIHLKDMSPLFIVSTIAMMYLGTLESIIWAVQTIKDLIGYGLLLLLPLNCVLITARTIRDKILEWETIPHETEKQKHIPLLRACNHFLEESKHWPIAAFFVMWPLLGILIVLLVLLGQEPNAAIKAWTETGGWNLSQKVSPQNIYYDEHYLCTVAAGGHKKVVKPLRLGIRHGHQVIVNRQLCIANAFEQILEERTPKFHKIIRNFYDRYGFPIAKHIHSQYTADGIYILMKPLEWLFLLVLYFVDVNPENRIAVQYTGKHYKEFI